jgi:hypothetical protein
MSVKSVSAAIVAAGTALAVCGCSFNGEPRVRLGSYATSTPGTRFIDANNLGGHSYGGSFFENNGIAYTCRGGHIDVTHARIGADNTRYLYNKARKKLMAGQTEFTYSLNVDRSTYFVKLAYPDNWASLPKSDKKRIADEVALELSQYLTFTMVTWHEILTWFGFKTMAVLPEFPSAFSWEDNYSNLLGIRLGAQAVQDQEHDYDEAITIALKKELENLGVQSGKTARDASAKMKGKWWDGEIFVDMKERNMDIGLVDGFVTPVLVPGVCPDAQPLSLPVPTLKTLTKYGFTLDLQIKPGEWESGQILKIVYPDGKGTRIHPATDIPVIIDYLKKDGISRGYTVMPPKAAPVSNL